MKRTLLKPVAVLWLAGAALADETQDRISPVVAGSSIRATVFAATVDDEWFRAWPPASVAYSFPSAVREEGRRLGDSDSLDFHATYIRSVRAAANFDWLVGADWQRIQTSVPSDVALPDTLQSAAAVLGFDWYFQNRWHARLEVLPGVFSDFRDVNGDNFNAPFNVEVSYAVNPNLLIGGQLNVNARRETPVLGAVGVRWRFTDDWLLSLWFPNPRVEYFATEKVTVLAGATFTGNTFVVGNDFGTAHGRPELNGQAVDFQEIRVGGGVRYTIKRKLAVELGGGWTLDRRYNFHERDVEFKSDGAPYVQLSCGLTF